MIAFIEGTAEAVGKDWIIINCQGIGYRIAFTHPESISLHTQVKVYTYLQVKEDGLSLFGFETREEQDLFLRLISVKGLGPKTAVSMLAKIPADQLIQSIEQGNVAYLKGIPGIGNKTASQIILDLKGKLIESEKKDETLPVPVQEACEALKNLGYKPGEISQAAKRMGEEPGKTTEQYLKIGLQYLMRTR